MLIFFNIPLNCWRWGRGGGFYFYSEFDIYFFVDDLHLQIIASISSKASVENSSALWGGEEREHISVKSFAGLVCVMLIWFVMVHNCLWQFRYFFLQSTLTNYCNHFPKSICREFISPVGYFYLEVLKGYVCRLKSSNFNFVLLAQLNLLASSRCILEKLFPSNIVHMELTVDVSRVSGDIWCITVLVFPNLKSEQD